MRRRKDAIARAVISAIVLVAIALFLLRPAPPPETKDRLSPDAMKRMVQGPMKIVRERGLAMGRENFDRLLTSTESRSGAGSVRAADLVTAFAVELYLEGLNQDDDAEKLAARDYLRDAIPRYRKAFGPKHPEVAVALHTFADADVALHDNRLTPEAEGALEEALQIRRASLGPQDRETLATERRLTRLRSGD